MIKKQIKYHLPPDIDRLKNKSLWIRRTEKYNESDEIHYKNTKYKELNK